MWAENDPFLAKVLKRIMVFYIWTSMKFETSLGTYHFLMKLTRF